MDRRVPGVQHPRRPETGREPVVVSTPLGTDTADRRAGVLFGVVSAIVLVVISVLNIFSSHLMAIMNNVSVWWHVAGAAVTLAATLAKSQEDRHVLDVLFDRFFFRAVEREAILSGAIRVMSPRSVAMVRSWPRAEITARRPEGERSKASTSLLTASYSSSFSFSAMERSRRSMTDAAAGDLAAVARRARVVRARPRLCWLASQLRSVRRSRLPTSV